MAINLSPLQFCNKNIIYLLDDMNKSLNLNSNLIDIEITENVMMNNIYLAKSILDSIKKMDIDISLDDFGTGYSSLNYLQQLPINNIKIDKSFIKKLDSTKHNREIIKAIIHMLML